MKSLLLKSIIPPFVFFILYINLNFFVFTFDARQDYLTKRVKKAEKEVETLNNELKTLGKNPKLKTYNELSEIFDRLEAIKNSNDPQTDKDVNIYQAFESNQLTLHSEQVEQTKGASKQELRNLTKFTISGEYQDVIEMLRTFSGSQLIPVRFTLMASNQGKTSYTISIWKKNEKI